MAETKLDTTEAQDSTYGLIEACVGLSGIAYCDASPDPAAPGAIDMSIVPVDMGQVGPGVPRWINVRISPDGSIWWARRERSALGWTQAPAPEGNEQSP